MIMEDKETMQVDGLEDEQENTIEELERDYQECTAQINRINQNIKEIRAQLWENKREEIIASIPDMQNLGPYSDAFFYKLSEDYEALEEVIGTVLDCKVLVRLACPRYCTCGNMLFGNELKNFFEVYALVELLEDSGYWRCGTLVNVELRKGDDEDKEEPWFYKGIPLLFEGSSDPLFKAVPNLAVICISDFDVFGDGQVLYETVVRDVKSGVQLKSPLRQFVVNLAGVDNDQEHGKAKDMARLFKERDAYDKDKFPYLSRRKEKLMHPDEA